MQILGRFRKLSLAGLAAGLISACAGNTENFQSGQLLSTDQSVLITKIRTNEKRVQVLMHGKADIGYPRVSFDVIKIPEDLKIVPIEAGIVCFSKVSQGQWQAWIPKERRLCSEIKSGTISYVGDFVTEIYGTQVRTKVLDEEYRTLEEARRLYPWLFEKYPYEKNIARITEK